MADNFTPGPWTACEPGAYTDFDGKSSVILGDDMRVAVVQGDDEQSVANASLIAAAPELYEALSRVLLDIDFSIERGVLPDIRDDMIYVGARSALAKAQGLREPRTQGHGVRG